MNDAHRYVRSPATILGFAAAFAALALAAPVAADQRVDVSGHLVGKDGRPVAGAEVRIVSALEARDSMSDRSGNFSVLGLNAAASATMTIETPGYEQLSCALQLFAGHAPHFRIRLVKGFTNIGRTNYNLCVPIDLNTNDTYDIN